MRKLVVAGLAAVVSIGVAATVYAAGTEKSVTGALRDGFCFNAAGAQGASHKKCAMACATKGAPVLLIEKGSGNFYVLLPPKDKQPLPSDVISHMEDEVTVTGKEYDNGGIRFLRVESVK